MTRYVAELYLPPASAADVCAAVSRAHSAALELSLEGTPIRYVRAIVLREDETCLHVYEAPSPECVLEASRRADISVDRVIEALDIEPKGVRP